MHGPARRGPAKVTERELVPGLGTRQIAYFALHVDNEWCGRLSVAGALLLFDMGAGGER
jgi:hypothetical protein